MTNAPLRFKSGAGAMSPNRLKMAEAARNGAPGAMIRIVSNNTAAASAQTPNCADPTNSAAPNQAAPVAKRNTCSATTEANAIVVGTPCRPRKPVRMAATQILPGTYLPSNERRTIRPAAIVGTRPPRIWSTHTDRRT